jgi:hypothetical protein
MTRNDALTWHVFDRDTGEITPCTYEDYVAWVKQDNDESMRRIGWDLLRERPRLLVSTVFLGIDHGHGRGAPVLFETMIFDDGKYAPFNQACMRWTLLDEAQAGHQHYVDLVRVFLTPEGEAAYRVGGEQALYGILHAEPDVGARSGEPERRDKLIHGLLKP